MAGKKQSRDRAIQRFLTPKFLAALYGRIPRKTGEDVRLNGEETRAKRRAGESGEPPPSPVVVSCLFLLLTASFSIPLNNMYEQYIHERRLYEEGVRSAAVVDEINRETRTMFLLPESPDFTFTYTYHLPNGDTRSGTARLNPERIGTIIPGDGVQVVYLPDWPSDSRLADGKPSMFMLVTFATGLGVLCLTLLLLVVWPHMARFVRKKAGGTKPEPLPTDASDNSEGDSPSEELETKRWPGKFGPWIKIVSFLGVMVLFGWIGKPYADSLLERIRLQRHGTVVPGRLLARGEESGEGASFVFSYRVDGREWMAERGYPRHISSRYRLGDDVRTYVLPGDPGTVQFADSVERNLWLRYGPILFFALAAEIALLVHIVLLMYRAVATESGKEENGRRS